MLGAAAAIVASGVVLATSALAATPVASGDYENVNQNRLDFLVVSRDGTSGAFTVDPNRCNDGLSIPGDRKATISPTGVVTYNGYGRGTDEVRGRLVTYYIKLVINGSFTSPNRLKWKATITVPGGKGLSVKHCKETVSANLKLTRIAR
jgi:hypothetical protein